LAVTKVEPLKNIEWEPISARVYLQSKAKALNASCWALMGWSKGDFRAPCRQGLVRIAAFTAAGPKCTNARRDGDRQITRDPLAGGTTGIRWNFLYVRHLISDL